MGWWNDLLSNPTLDKSRMTRKDNGKRKGDWLQPAAEWVSDAIPNEFSKLSNNWTGNIPYVGWVLRGLAGADNFSETYANGGDLIDSAQHGWTGFSGNAADPNLYSEKNQAGRFGNGDTWLSIGQGINLVPSSGGASWMKYGNMGSQGLGTLRSNGMVGSNGLPQGGLGGSSNQLGAMDIGGLINSLYGNKQPQQMTGYDTTLLGVLQKHKAIQDAKMAINEMMNKQTMAPRIYTNHGLTGEVLY